MTINEVVSVIEGHRRQQVENLKNTRFLMWTMVKMWGKDAPGRPEDLMKLPGDLEETPEDLQKQSQELLELIKSKTVGSESKS
jgi:hypothetical protein